MKLPSGIKIKSYHNKKSYKANPEIKLLNFNKLNKLILDKKYHEWINENDIVKPYYDIDLGFKTEEEMKNNDLPIREKWIKILNDIYPDCKLAISSCNRYKENPSKSDIKKGIHYFISIHFIVNNYYIKQGDMEDYNKKLGLEQYEEYDVSVYKSNQNFRLVNQSKPEKNNNITIFSPITFTEENEIKYHVIQLTNDYNLSNMKYIKIDRIDNQNNNNNDNIVMEEPEEKIDELLIPNEKTDIKEIEKYLLQLPEQKYNDCLAICLAVYNETDGNDNGKNLLKKWFHKTNDTNDFSQIEYNWNKWKTNGNQQKYTMGTIMHYYIEQIGKPITNNIYEEIYCKNYKKKKEENEDGEVKIKVTGIANIKGLVEELNKKVIYNRSNSEVIYLENKDVWISKKLPQIKQDFTKYSFIDTKSKSKINPINIWLESLDRREVSKINFDPSDIPEKDIFNIWKGFNINKDDCKDFNIDDCNPLTNHIYNRWCNGNPLEYDYVLNYLAHILQKPWIKMGVVLCLRSKKEGSGKGLVMNKLREIIGNNHYFQCNNLNQITSDFNGITEGKILTNLDEAFWGKDKSKEGMLKNIITEETKLINKKNKEAYIIDDYSNYILTTNNDCFIPAATSGRRYYPLECSNELSGIQNQEKRDIIDSIRNVPSGSFAKLLYERDISNFNPRQFNKTDLLQDQIEQNWNNVKTWWFDILKENRFTGKSIKNNYCGFGDIPESSSTNMDGDCKEKYGYQKIIYKYDNNRHKIKNEYGDNIILGCKILYEKDFLYHNYLENTNNGYKYSKQSFFEKFKECIGEDLFKSFRHRGSSNDKYYLQIKDIKLYREVFNEMEEYEYEYEDYEYISESDYESDEE